MTSKGLEKFLEVQTIHLKCFGSLLQSVQLKITDLFQSQEVKFRLREILTCVTLLGILQILRSVEGGWERVKESQSLLRCTMVPGIWGIQGSLRVCDRKVSGR